MLTSLGNLLEHRSSVPDMKRLCLWRNAEV